MVNLNCKTFKVLQERKRRTGVPMCKQIEFHVLGKQAKLKGLLEK